MRIGQSFTFYLRLLKTQTVKPKYQLHKNVAFLKSAR